MLAKAVTYTGTGVSGLHVDVGFQPDLVIVDMAHFRIANHPTGQSSSMSSDAPNATNSILSFDATGFTMGNSTATNTAAVTYQAIAIKDNGAGDFKVGTYTGDNTNNRPITGLGFQPRCVMIKGNSSHYAWWHPAALAGTTTLPHAAFSAQGSRIVSLNADGFTLGNDIEIQETGIAFYWFAFGNDDTIIKTGTYTGNAADDRNITGVGFTPEMVWVKGQTSQKSVGRVSTVVGDLSTEGGVGTYVADKIQAFSADGFQVGTHATVNSNAVTYYWIAVSKGHATSTYTMTAQISILNPTHNLQAQIWVKRAQTYSFTAGLVIHVPGVKGALAELQYKSVDTMKNTKDNTRSQFSDTQIANVINFIGDNLAVTHIGVSCPIDKQAWYPSGYVPASRNTFELLYAAWVDPIHARGLRVLHRAESFAMRNMNIDGYQFHNPNIPGGTYADIFPTTWSDSFNRAQVETSITANNTSYTDDFERTTGIGSNYETPLVGPWSILNGELISSGTANATSNIILTTAQYTDFTIQAKVLKSSLTGFKSIAYRMRHSSTLFPGRGYCSYYGGYLLELRDSNNLRLEDIATANLTSVTFPFTAGVYYQVKIQVAGNQHTIKVWEDGSPEPSTATLTYIDPQNRFTTGSVGFCCENSGSNSKFDNLVVTYAPTQTVVSDWNKIGTGWQTESNDLLKNINSGPQYANVLYTKTSYTNFTMTAKFKSFSAGQLGKIGMIFRGRVVTFGYGFNAYTIRMRDNSIIELEDMSLANLQTVPKTFDPDSWYNIKIVAANNNFKSYVWKVGDSEPSIWDIDYTDTSNRYPTGSVGFSSENIAPTRYNDFVITPTQNKNNWCGFVYDFIKNNPTFFMNGDLWAPFPEMTEEYLARGNYPFGTSPSPDQAFTNFFAEHDAVARKAFEEIGKPGVLVGVVSQNYSELNSFWIGQRLLQSAGTITTDFYSRRVILDYELPGSISHSAPNTTVAGAATRFLRDFRVVSENGDTYGDFIRRVAPDEGDREISAIASDTSLTVKSAFAADAPLSSRYGGFTGVSARQMADDIKMIRTRIQNRYGLSLPVFLQEWGLRPDEVNMTRTSFPLNVVKRDSLLRKFYTYLGDWVTEGWFKHLNYWGFWDTGDNDTGLVQVTSYTTGVMKLRHAGWVLKEAFEPGPNPLYRFDAQVCIQKASTYTFTAQVSVEKVTVYSFTAQISVIVHPPVPPPIKNRHKPKVLKSSGREISEINY